MKHKILCVIGTRPEAIKMAPIILAFKKMAQFELRILATAQHRSMLDDVMKVFGITPDIDLNIMTPNQDLTTLTARLLVSLDKALLEEKPDAVLAQGDTTTVMTVALTCFYHNIYFGHVEAGLRTWDIQNPFPEEMNRSIAGKLARWHFSPTESSRQNLLKEGVPNEKIILTGNTVIDALLSINAKETSFPIDIDPSKRLILVTAHRRENFGKPFERVCSALIKLLDHNPNAQVLFPVHPNPNVWNTAHRLLGDHPRVILSNPLDYSSFVLAMRKSYIIISDSGGIQEEAPALGKPVLVLRDETERPEAVREGVVMLVGTNVNKIFKEAHKLLTDDLSYRNMAKGVSPYGDGHAAARIVNFLGDFFTKKK